MNSDFLLSRLCITGKLDESTPLEVILAVADVHCIDYSDLDNLEKIGDLIEKINEEKVETVSRMRKDEDYERISHFVNPNKDVIWNKEDLEVAFAYLTSFSDSRFYKEIHPAFAFGSQTPENPRTLNECVIYSACRYYNIELTLYTKVEEMVNMLRYFLSSKELIIEAITNKLISSDVTVKRLLDIEHMIHKSINGIKSPKLMQRELESNVKELPPVPQLENYNFPPDYQKINKIAQDVNIYYPTEDAIKSYIVNNHEDAIVITSILYGLDITNEKDPHNVYKGLLKNGAKLSQNPIKFNCNFSIDMYTSGVLSTLLKIEGYNNDELNVMDKDAMYEALQVISLSNNFFHGKKKPYLHKETLINNDIIENLDNEDCISFGYTNGYVIYTYNELYELYNHSKTLYEPIELAIKVPLSFYSVKKLRYLTKKLRDNTFLELINTLDNAYNSSDSLTIKIKESIDEDLMKKEVLSNFMDILVKLAMNMRGWSGKGEYPVKSAHQLEDHLVDIRVGESLVQMDVYTDAYPELCKSILALPLVRYHHGKYIIGDETNGRTLGDRIKIIKGPRSNSFSCIKLSSNWIASSIYKYCVYFGIDPKFNIEELKQIA